MEPEHYRSELAAPLLRIEQLTGELALHRLGPAHEQVVLAEQRLEVARARRRRAQIVIDRRGHAARTRAILAASESERTMARDKADQWAHAVVAILLERREIELASASSRPELERIVAQRLSGPTEALANVMMQFAGVAELHADDETLARIVADNEPEEEPIRADTSPPSEKPAQSIRDLSRLEPQMRVVLQSAAGRAARRGHRFVTLAHVLREMLVVRAVVALATRRDGDPEAAIKGADAQIARLPSGGEGRPSLSPEVIAVLDRAEDAVPRWAGIGDVALAAMAHESHDGGLFRLAFGSGSGRPAEAEAKALDDEDIEDAPDEEAPANARRIGRLEVSRALADAVTLLRSHARPSDELWTRGPILRAKLSLRDVEACERELGVHLPDDFWAIAAAGIDTISCHGIAAMPSHGEPAPPEEVTEIVLTAMSDAASALDLGDLVAFVDLREVASAAEGEDFLCVRRGASFAERNDQPVLVVGADGATDHATFGAWLLDRTREAHGEPRRVAGGVTLDVRLA